MAQASSTRLAARVVWLAAAIFVLSAGIASAKSDGGHSGGHNQAKLADARALGGFDRCLRARTDRVKRLAVRRRCAQASNVSSGSSKAAAPNRTPQPLYWGATIGSHLTGTQAPWDMSAAS